MAEQKGWISGPQVAIYPMGRIDLTAVAVIAANIQAVLGLNTRIRPLMPEPEYAFQIRREQYEAGKILQVLEGVLETAPLRLAVVAVDLFTPILTFVFGESHLGGKAAVVSLHRLRGKTPQQTYERAVKIALHEMGHLLGLTHCQGYDCLMHFPHSLEGLDHLPPTYCPACTYESGRRLQSLFGGG